MKKNPYITGLPVSNDGEFFGRKKLLNAVRSCMHQNHWCVEIHGPRRIGKTSLAHRVAEDMAAAWPDSARVFIDGEGFLAAESGRSLIEKLHQEIAAALGDRVPQPVGNPSAKDALEYLVASASAAKIRILVVLDEVQALVQRGRLGLSEFSYLRALTQLTKSHLSYVVSTLTPLKTLSRDAVSSGFANIFSSMSWCLGPLARPDALEMVSAPALRSGIELPAGAAEEIYALCGGHPHLTAMLAFRLADEVLNDTPPVITSKKWREWCLDLARDALDLIFEHVPTELHDKIRHIVPKYSHSYKYPSPAAKALLDTGFCVMNQRYLQPTGKLFDMYLEETMATTKDTSTPQKKKKPRIFVGSSVEGLKVAKQIQMGLEYVAECDLWTQGIFTLSTSTLDSLVAQAKSVDFAVLVLTADDVITKRGQKNASPRDNVIFELGLFMGAIGPQRTYIVHPRNVKLDLPTDLDGITKADYEARDNLAGALGTAITKIEQAIESQW